MAAPWERYQSTQAAPEASASGPWGKYAAKPESSPERPVTDLEPVFARPSPQDDPQFTFPQRPGRGEDLLAWARFKRPELEKVPDQQLATLIRRQVYPDMSPVDFYRETGFGEKFGYDLSQPDPVEGMTGGQKFRAGMGSAFASTPRGVRQLATDSAGNIAGLTAVGLDAIGLDSAAKAVAEKAVLPIKGESERLRKEETERRRLDQPLMRSGAGLAGNITGNVLQIIGPGAGLKLASRVPQLARVAPTLESASSVFLPETIPGSTASGAAFGGLQPVAEGETREGNIGLGGLGGFGGAAIPRGVGAGTRFVGNLIPSVSERAQQRAAGEFIERFSQDPDAVRAALTQKHGLVAGSLPTTAEATGDIGLGGLQRTLANSPEFGAELTLRKEANNRARVAAIEEAFGGANAKAAETLTSARDLAARQSLHGLATTPVSDIGPVQNGLNRMLVKYQANRPIREAMSEINAELANIKTVQDAHFLRQYIGQLMSGQVEGKQSAKLATKELMTVRDLLDRQMRQDFPEWGNFLRNYKTASRKIGQVNVGEALLDKGPNIRAIGEIPELSPDKFAGAAADLDRTVQKATNFRRATAERVLTPRQIEVVDEVRRDLERYARARDRGRAVGSNTVQNAIGGNRVQDAVGPVGAAMIEPASGAALLALNAIRKNYGEKVAAIVNEAMLDPNRAAEILAALPPKSRRMIVQQVAGLINQAGSVAGRVYAPSNE